MNRTIRTLLTALATITVCAGLFLAGGSAQAAPAHEPGRLARVAGDMCHGDRISEYYVHHWQTIPVAVILNSTFTFHEHVCRTNGFRLYKSVSNTRPELRFARHFLKAKPPKGDPQRNYKPAIFCRTSRDHTYFLDLAFYWGQPQAPHMNKPERRLYTHWAHRYARRHGCRLFSAKGA